MKTKFLVTLVLILSFILLIYGCGSKNKTNIGDISNDFNEAGEGLKNGTEDIVEDIKDGGQDIKYSAITFKEDFLNAGHGLKESDKTHWNKFKGKETDYYAGNELVRIYEYNSKNELNNDVSLISSDGLSVDGETAYTKKPHYYTKGNTLIVYEGNDKSYLYEFNKMYGNSIRS